MTTKGQHVVPRDGKWAVRRDGAAQCDAPHFDTQREAIGATQYLARKQRTDVFIHERGGARSAACVRVKPADRVAARQCSAHT